MGNSFRKLSHCCSCNGESHEMMTRLPPPDPALEFVGHSFSYVQPDPAPLSYSKCHSLNDSSASSSSSSSSSRSSSSSSAAAATSKTTTFRSISGASVGANITGVALPLAGSSSSPPPSLPDRSVTFESSELVASLTLQPVPRGSTQCWSGPVERGVLFDKFERSLSNGHGNLRSSSTKKKSLSLTKSFKKLATSNKPEKASLLDTERSNEDLSTVDDDDDDDDQTDDDGDGDGDGDGDDELSSIKSQNWQWAQGKAGEDRTHLVVSEEEGWIFVGIYDGFSGPDAPDYLLANLFNAVFEELKGLLSSSSSSNGKEKCWKKWKCDWDSKRLELSMDSSMETNYQHSSDVLKALSEALRKTEEAYLKMADSNPELHIMGSCVLVMLMNGEDVYLMNVGDSRAILAQHHQLEEGSNSKTIPLQLTMDHNADVQEEVERIRNEHPDDHEAVVNERVKGYLKVTRAFGAGFLKHPKWNDALYEIIRIKYVGTSPYITSSPSLYHYKLRPNDRFLILSSDGLYQYFTNEQVVSEVEWFTSSFPEGDPAQHLVEQVLIRAAKKASLEFHELVEIPPGERRMYHDDVSVIIISLQGRVWHSSVNRNIGQLIHAKYRDIRDKVRAYFNQFSSIAKIID